MNQLIRWDPKCHIARRKKREINIGDLVFFKRYQPVPVTVLVLNSQEEKFMVQTWEKDGLSYLTPKHSLKLTARIDFFKIQVNNQDGQKQTFIYYKRILTGKIEFDTLNDGTKFFKGYIKLQKDPKGEYIDFNNIITHSSVILNTDWVVGIVITNDDDEIINLWNTLFFKNSRNDLQIYQDRYSFLFILFSVFSYFISLSEVILFSKYPAPDYLVNELTPYKLMSVMFRSIGIIQPAIILFSTELMFLIIERRFKDHDDVIINDPSELLNLTDINLCIYDKTGTLTNANTILGGIIVCNQFFPVQEEKFVRKQTQVFKRLKTKNFTQFNQFHGDKDDQIDEEEEEVEFNHNVREIKPEVENSSEDSKLKIKLDDIHLGLNAIIESELQFKKSIICEPRSGRMGVDLQSLDDDAIFIEEKGNFDKNTVFQFDPRFLSSKVETLDTQKIKVINKPFIDNETFENFSPYSESSAKFLSTKRDRSRQRNPLTKIQVDSEMIQIDEDVNQEAFLNSIKVPSEQIYDEDDMIKMQEENDEHNQKDLRDLIRLGNPQVTEFMRSLILCQDIKTKSSKKKSSRLSKAGQGNVNQSQSQGLDATSYNPQHFVHENTDEYQESLIKYTKLYGYEFICAGELNKRLCYEINAIGLSERYKVIKKIQNVDTFTILFEKNRIQLNEGRRNRAESKQQQIHVYVKSQTLNLLDLCLLSKARRINIEKHINQLQAQGYRFVLYAGKQIDQKEFNQQYFQVQNSNHSFNSTQQSQISDQEVFDDLEFYGVTCLKEQYNQGSQMIARQLARLDITQWVLSEDKKQNTIATCFSIGIIQNHHTILRIDEEDEEKLKLQIKSQLLFIRKQLLKETETTQINFDQKVRDLFPTVIMNRSQTVMTGGAQCSKKFIQYQSRPDIDDQLTESSNMKGEEPLQDVCVVVNGKSLRLILEDSYMKAHFLFIAMIVKSVVTYDCSPQDKACFCLEVSEIMGKDNFMTVTDSIDDTKMNRYAQANIHYINPKGLMHLAYAHLMVTNLQHIHQFILHFSQIIRSNIRCQTVIIVKCTFVLQSILLCLYYKTHNINQSMKLVYQVMLLFQILVPVSIICQLNDKSDDQKLEIILPQLIPQFHKILQNNWKWTQEFIFEISITTILTSIISTQLFRNFMLARTAQNPFHRDIWTSNDLIFILMSGVNCALLISHMLFINVHFKKILQMIFLNICTLIIGLAIGVDSLLTRVIIRQVFSLNFLLGLFTLMVMIVMIDYKIKHLKVLLFGNKQLKEFIEHNQCKMTFDPDGNVLFPKIQSYTLQQNIKITNSFFNNLKKAFNDVLIDPFIRSCKKILLKLVFDSETRSSQHEHDQIVLTFADKSQEQTFRDTRIKKYFSLQRLIFTAFLIVTRVLSEFYYNFITSTAMLNRISLAVWILMLMVKKFRTTSNNPQIFHDYCLKYGKIELYFVLPVIFILLQLGRLFLTIDTMEVFYYDAFNQVIQYQILTQDIFPPPLIYPSILIFVFQLTYLVRNLINLNILYKNQSDEQITVVEIQVVTTLLIVFQMSLINMFNHRDQERMHRLSFQADLTTQLQQESTNQILKLLLPAFIYDKIEQDDHMIEENQGNVAIIFVEICHFDQILQSKQRQVVAFLDDIFRVFDKICLQHGVQKIETVGKTYMACSGLKSLEQEKLVDSQYSKSNETGVSVEVAFEFLKSIQEFRFNFQGKIQHLKIKIGIHYGQVLAGVIGYHKPQFSLIGDTVNTASRMCSTGDESKISISEAAYFRVMETPYLFVEKIIYAKGKGDLVTYQVFEREFKIKKRISLPSNIHTIISKIDIKASGSFNRITRAAPGTTMGNNSEVEQQRGRVTYLRRSRVQTQKHTSNAGIIIRKPQDRGTLTPNFSAHRTTHPQFEEDQVRSRSKTQNIIVKAQQQWSEEQEDEIKINQIEWYPENRMIGSVIDTHQFVNSVTAIENLVKNKKVQALKYTRFSLAITKQNDAVTINQFQIYLTKVRSEKQVFFMTIVIVSFIVRSNLYLLNIHDDSDSSNYMVRLLMTLGSILLAFICTQTKRSKTNNIDEILNGVFYIAFAIGNLAFSITDNQYINIDVLSIYTYAFAAVNQQAMKFQFMFVYILAQMIIWVCLVASYKLETNTIAFIIISSMSLIVNSYDNYQMIINDFNSQANEILKKEQKDSLLTNLLPSHILTRFYQNNKIKLELSDELKSATLLFADIAGFTAYSSSVGPEQVVEMLRQLMTAFDKECLQKNVYKVYTIGDCYVVLGINNMEQRNPGQEAKNVVEMGLEMIEIISQIRKLINFQGLNMRIGIHTGEFYGGIIGTDIVRYDIFGVDAVIANKMESNGNSAQVMVSEDTKELIDNHFPGEYQFVFHQEVDVPVAKRKVKGYFVTKRDNQE